MRTHRIPQVVALAVAVSLLGYPAWGDFTISLSDHDLDGDGSWHSTTVSPGSFFDIFVDLSDIPLNQMFVAGQFNIGASISDVVSLTAVAFDGVEWSNDPLDVKVPEPLPAMLSPKMGIVGTLAVDLENGTNYEEFGRLTFALTPGWTGVFTLMPFDGIFGDLEFIEKFYPDIGEGYVVRVIPAPGAALLGVIGLATVRMVRRR